MSAAGRVIVRAYRDADRAAVVGLIEEYARGLGVDLGFQHFAEELATFPGPYVDARRLARGPSDASGLAAEFAASRARILVACPGDGEPIGCVCLKSLGPGLCEMKRLYVEPGWRGGGLGRALARAIMRWAAVTGDETMVLDTLESLTGAVRLYRDLGFRETSPYYVNPLPGVLYFRRSLADIHPEARTFKALSLVAPGGTRIASGEKTVEVRRWRPPGDSLSDLLIVENTRYLHNEGDEDRDGTAVAIVDVERVTAWTPDLFTAACATRFEEGLWAWHLGNVRPVCAAGPVLAARGIYLAEIVPIDGGR